MSRIGKKPVPVGAAKVTVQDGLVRVEGPKGKLEQKIPATIKVRMDADKKELVVERPDDDKQSKALHGLTRALLANMVEGVTNGYEKRLSIVGVGYRAALKGKALEVQVGYSHPVTVAAVDGIEFETPTPTQIVVRGNDKQLVGEVAANIRKIRKPEPYKGKGIRYENEYVRKKAGKAAKTATA